MAKKSTGPGSSRPNPAGDPESELALPVGSRDHILGWIHAPVVLLEYGDYECPYSRRADEIVHRLQKTAGSDLKFVFRHFPLEDVHPQARLAALSAEAAARQGKFWEMHRMLFREQDDLSPDRILRLALKLGLNEKRFIEDLENPAVIDRVEEDERLAEESGVDSTPTFFLNGRLYEGSWEFDDLLLEIQREVDLNSLKRAI